MDRVRTWAPKCWTRYWMVPELVEHSLENVETVVPVVCVSAAY